MSKKVLKINTHLGAIPSWLKINNSITVPLPLRSAKELATKLLEVQEDIEIELNFSTGSKTVVEIKFEAKEEEQPTAKKVLRINTRLGSIPDWLKIKNSITIPLPMKSARELATKLLEVQEDVEIEINFLTGKKTSVEIKYEAK